MIAPLLIAVDTGGTFTDAVAVCGGRVETAKVPSTPDDPARAVATAVAELRGRFGGAACARLIHGTTVATNALLEGRGASTVLVTNAGFEDVLEIGRQHRADLFAFEPVARPAIIPAADRVGVQGRLDPTGRERAPLDLEALDRVLASLDARRRSWAVVLLHAYANPAHEEAVAVRIRAARPDDVVSLSSDVLPVFREYERASTTAANAFVRPLMAGYLRRLRSLAETVQVMGSSGGRLTVEAAADLPVATALSGPAGGVVAATAVARARGLPGVISFDMGGTSTDVALCESDLPIRHDGRVGAYPIHVAMLDIHTIGAGGGSIARLDAGGALRVGPESAGADPGPACYGRGTAPTVTDANVVLGRLPADAQLGGRMPIVAERAFDAVGRLAAESGLGVEAIAAGILEIAVEKMARAIRRVSVERGVDPRERPLCVFGGAGGLHACALAEALGLDLVLVPARAGLLSAVGMLQGRAVAERSQTVLGRGEADVDSTFASMRSVASAALGEAAERAVATIDLRYAGQSFELGVPHDGTLADAVTAFEAAHERRFGYRLEAPVEWVTAHMRVEGAAPDAARQGLAAAVHPDAGSVVVGPASIVDLSSTTWVAPGWSAERERDGTLVVRRAAVSDPPPPLRGGDGEARASIELELFRHRFAAIAEEMGEVLTLAGFSPNIKERRDHSCALFDAAGDMVAQAAHIPVHLGAAPLCVKAVIGRLDLADGETAIVNDPFAGGTHLPDITLVTAVDLGPGLRFYVATRAHHADVGGISPGSLPLSRTIDDEGWRCSPRPLDDEVVASLLAASRTPQERRGDLAAQRAANDVGRRRLLALAARFGGETVGVMADGLQDYAERLTGAYVDGLVGPPVEVEDVLDDAMGDGVPVTIRLRLDRGPDGRLVFDFSASDDAVEGPMNAVRAIVESAVFYAMLCLLGGDAPANGGVMRCVDVRTRAGSVVDARAPSAVAAGNVETSQRLVDVIFAALAPWAPDRVPASSCGSMNNVLIGSMAAAARPFVYYETVCGGLGGGPRRAGASATQAHMTNTRNTPVEAFEHAFPVTIDAYRILRGTGGPGARCGGDGVERIYGFEVPATVTVIGERRLRGAPGLAGGSPGTPGAQWLIRADGSRVPLAGKATIEVSAGERLVVRTPGGGGHGS